MIDWLNLFFNSLWIIALAIALAVVSWASWRAAEAAPTEKRSGQFGFELSRRIPQIYLSLAGALFCIGLAGTSTTLWQQVLWILFAAVFLWQWRVAFRNR